MILELGAEHFSPALLRKIVFLGGNCFSFEEAHKAVMETLEIELSARHIETLSERIGLELAARRDRAVALFERDALPAPEFAQAPHAVAVAVDDGKLRIRLPDSSPGVHGHGWHNNKVACLTTYALQSHACDPMPEPPEAFLHHDSVQRLVAELGHVRSDPKPSAPPCKPSPANKSKPPPVWAPRPLVRSCVVTHTQPAAFAAMVAAEARSRRFDEACERVFLGDGGAGNWTIQEMHFSDYLPLLDFVHLVEHLYAASRAGEKHVDWSLYTQLVHAAWAGLPDLLIKLLDHKAQRLGPPPEEAADDDPRKIVALNLAYVTRNRQHLNYPRARRLGLPVSTSQVESLINTVNLRVKACGKFWCPDQAEGILQVRGATLSQTDRWGAFWRTREAAQLGRIRAPVKRAA